MKMQEGTVVVFNRRFDNQNNFRLISIPEQKGTFLGRVIRDEQFANLPEQAYILKTESGGLVFVPVDDYSSF